MAISLENVNKVANFLEKKQLIKTDMKISKNSEQYYFYKEIESLV